MKAENFTKEESNNAPEVRLNKTMRDELGVKVGDKVLITRITKEVVEAEVHQARRNQIDEVRLIGGTFEEEKDPEVEIKRQDEVDADTTDGDDFDDDENLEDDFEDEEE